MWVMVHAPDQSLRPWWDAARLQASCDLLRPVHDPRISLSFLLPFRALLAIFFFLSGSIVTGIFSQVGKFCRSVTGRDDGRRAIEATSAPSGEPRLR